MRFPSLPAYAALLLAFATSAIQAQQPAAPAAPVNPAAPANPADSIHPAVRHLSDAQREELKKHLQEASKLAQSQRSLEMFIALDEASKLAPGYFGIYNLRGVGYSHLREFDKAKAEFARAAELEPRALDVKFNLAEMDFVSGGYDAALAQFQKLLKDNPKLPTATYQLLRYKEMICLLKKGMSAEAQKVHAAFSPYETTPIFHMGKAAIEFAQGNEDEAQSWIRSARGIYKPQQVANFLDAIIEVGWIDSLAKPEGPAPTGG